MPNTYYENLRQKLIEKAVEYKFNFKDDAVYVWREGPRFETETEIKMIRGFVGEVVDMKSGSEVVIVKELFFYKLQ